MPPAAAPEQDLNKEREPSNINILGVPVMKDKLVQRDFKFQKNKTVSFLDERCVYLRAHSI